MCHIIWILSKIVFDTLGKISVIFVWITLMDSCGNFQPLLVVFLYYGIFLILVIFNIIFNMSEAESSLAYVIGKN